jgi:heat shock protein HslJ
MDPELAGPGWISAAINEKPVAGGTLVTLIFSEANNILGSTDCNLYAGTYVFGEGSTLNFKPDATSSWKCEEPFLAQEKAMLLVLSSSSNHVIEAHELNITNPDGVSRTRRCDGPGKQISHGFRTSRYLPKLPHCSGDV